MRLVFGASPAREHERRPGLGSDPGSSRSNRKRGRLDGCLDERCRSRVASAFACVESRNLALSFELHFAIKETT